MIHKKECYKTQSYRGIWKSSGIACSIELEVYEQFYSFLLKLICILYAWINCKQYMEHFCDFFVFLSEVEKNIRLLKLQQTHGCIYKLQK